MRQHHVAGDKAFVDYSGKRIGIVDPATGEIQEAEIFVAVLGASNLTYAEATWTQQLPDWTGAHVRMFRFFGGVPKLLVPDDLKSGVNKASFYSGSTTDNVHELRVVSHDIIFHAVFRNTATYLIKKLPRTCDFGIFNLTKLH